MNIESASFLLSQPLTRTPNTPKLLQCHPSHKTAANPWILSTNEFFQLIGVKTKGERYIRGGWQFIQQGKIGHQAGWKVVKMN